MPKQKRVFKPLLEDLTHNVSELEGISALFSDEKAKVWFSAEDGSRFYYEKELKDLLEARCAVSSSLVNIRSAWDEASDVLREKAFSNVSSNVLNALSILLKAYEISIRVSHLEMNETLKTWDTGESRCDFALLRLNAPRAQMIKALKLWSRRRVYLNGYNSHVDLSEDRVEEYNQQLNSVEGKIKHYEKEKKEKQKASQVASEVLTKEKEPFGSPAKERSSTVESLASYDSHARDTYDGFMRAANKAGNKFLGHEEDKGLSKPTLLGLWGKNAIDAVLYCFGRLKNQDIRKTYKESTLRSWMGKLAESLIVLMNCYDQQSFLDDQSRKEIADEGQVGLCFLQVLQFDLRELLVLNELLQLDASDTFREVLKAFQLKLGDLEESANSSEEETKKRFEAESDFWKEMREGFKPRELQDEEQDKKEESPVVVSQEEGDKSDDKKEDDEENQKVAELKKPSKALEIILWGGFSLCAAGAFSGLFLEGFGSPDLGFGSAVMANPAITFGVLLPLLLLSVGSAYAALVVTSRRQEWTSLLKMLSCHSCCSAKNLAKAS